MSYVGTPDKINLNSHGALLYFFWRELSSIISICRPPTSGGNFLCGNAFQMEMTWHHSFLTLEHVFLFKSEIYLSTFIPCKKYHLGLTTDFSFDLGTFWTIYIIVCEWWYCKLYQIAWLTFHCLQGDKGTFFLTAQVTSNQMVHKQRNNPPS